MSDQDTSEREAELEEVQTTEVPETTDTGGTVWDAPNQQVVREDESAPWDEGTGGSSGQADEKTADTTDADAETSQKTDLDSMTKAQLLEYAKSKGISPANNDMTKEELRANIDAAER